MKIPNDETIKLLKREYPEGTRVVLIDMIDKRAVPEGTEGTVVAVDGIGNIIMKWDNGSTLSLIPELDKFKKI